MIGIFIRRSRIYQKKCERARVWAASCERTFGGIGKAKAASEDTDNLRYTQTKSQKTTNIFNFLTFLGGKELKEEYLEQLHALN